MKSKAIKEVACVLKSALGVSTEDDDIGIFTQLVEIDDGQWAIGVRNPFTLFELLDNFGGYVSLAKMRNTFEMTDMWNGP